MEIEEHIYMHIKYRASKILPKIAIVTFPHAVIEIVFWSLILPNFWLKVSCDGVFQLPDFKSPAYSYVVY